MLKSQIELEERFSNAQKENVAEKVLEDAAKQIASLTPEVLYRLGGRMSAYVNEGRKILITGIGKPGFVAQKCAATLKSIRVNAEYLDAITAGHGDLGSIDAEEPSLLIMLSKSGRSTELKTLCENVNICCPATAIVLLTMTNDIVNVSKLYDGIENLEILSLTANPAELDGNGIIPSTSNAMFEMALSASVAVAMQTVGDNIELWIRLKNSHPSGSLQNKVTKLLSEIQDNEQQQ